MKKAEKFKYKPTRFMLPTSHYDKTRADRAVLFIQSLKHTKGVWDGKPFDLLPWQEQIIRDLFGVIKENGYRQFNTAYIELGKKNGKSELAAAVALYMLCADNEKGAEIYGCANDRAQAGIVFDVAKDMVLHSDLLKGHLQDCRRHACDVRKNLQRLHARGHQRTHHQSQPVLLQLFADLHSA